MFVMRGRGLFFRKGPSLALPPEKITVGRFWGRGRFSKRSASPPDPLSRRVAGNRLDSSFEGSRPCNVGAFSCFGSCGRGGSVSRRDRIPKQKDAPIFHGRASLKESSSLFPAALRVGVRGRRFSQRSGLPRSTPSPALTSMPPLLIRSLSCLDRRFDRGRRGR